MVDEVQWKTTTIGKQYPMENDNFEKKMTSKKCPRTSMEASYGALQFHVLLEVTYGPLYVPLEVTYEAVHMSF